MYAMAPVALGALHRSDGDRPRSYKMPAPKVILPIAFVSANLILYWGGYNVNLKVIGAIAVGLVIFVIGSVVNKTHAFRTFKNSWWIPVWLGGILVIGYLGRYGDSNINWFPAFADEGVVVAFGLVIYYLAAVPPPGAQRRERRGGQGRPPARRPRRADHGLSRRTV